MLWMGRLTDGRSVAVVAAPAIILLVLTHTRTATFGLTVGLGFGLLSLALVSRRARQVFTGGALSIGLLAFAFSPAIQAWVQRGDAESFSNLTGRAKVWDAVLTAPRTTAEQFFGVGLTNKSYQGLPIDSSWLAVYYEQGYVGIAIVAMFLLALVGAVALRPASPAKACAVFLIAYCITASYTEAGLSDASPYLLNLAVAATLLPAAASASTGPLRPGAASDE